LQAPLRSLEEVLRERETKEAARPKKNTAPKALEAAAD